MTFRNVIFVVISLLTSVVYATEVPISYEIIVPQQISSCLTIKSSFTLDASGEMLVKIPEKGINSLNYHSRTSVSVKQSEKPYIYQIIGQPEAQVDFDYGFCANKSFQNLDQPLISEDFFFLLPINSFIFPILEGDKQWKIKVSILNLPDHFILYANNFDFNHSAIFDNGRDFLITPITAGQYQPISKSNETLTANFIARGEPQNFPSNYLNDFYKVMSAQYYFWHEKEKEPQFVILNAKNKANYQSGSHPVNTLALNYWRDVDYVTGLHAFSHENFHHWLGRKIKFPNDCGHIQWLIEGMTDYFGLRIAHESGVMDDESYIQNLNETIRKYYLSPFKELSNLETGNKIRQEKYFQSLALLRAHLAAYQVENLLDEPLNDSSLGQALIQLRKVYDHSEKVVVTDEMIEGVFSSLLGEQWNQMKSLINGTRSIELPKELLRGNARLESVTIIAPNFGFNLKSFLDGHKFEELDESGSAYKAGLRSSDQILGHSLRLYALNEPSEIYVRDGDRVKTIPFFPQKGEEISVPKYVLLNG